MPEPSPGLRLTKRGFASDYIYRGTTLSDHGPAAGAAVEATFGALYAGSTAATVNLPTQPAAELTASGGIRPKLANINFDLGVTYFAYPGERLPGETNGINYWETVIRADRSISEQVRVAGGYAYSPNVWNTGAWSQYVAGGVGYDFSGLAVDHQLKLGRLLHRLAYRFCAAQNAIGV